jgi:hypothetical protein
MKRRIGLLALCCLLVAAAAQAGPARRAGLGASAMPGLNLCVSYGNADCDDNDYDPSFGITLGAFYRIIPYLAADFDFYVGLVNPSNGDAHSIGFFIGPRGIWPIGPVDLSFGIGIGYGEHKLAAGDPPNNTGGAESGFAMAFVFGVDYLLAERWTLGLQVRYHLDLFDEWCGHYGSTEVCHDMGDQDPYNHMMIGLRATFLFWP